MAQCREFLAMASMERSEMKWFGIDWWLDDELKFSERLQMDATLSLVKAVNMARPSENVHKQQKVVRASNSVELKSGIVDAIRVPKFKKQEGKKVSQTSKYLGAARKTACPRCGNVFHNRNVCPGVKWNVANAAVWDIMQECVNQRKWTSYMVSKVQTPKMTTRRYFLVKWLE